MIALLLTVLAADTLVIDSFDSVSQWTTNPAAGVEITVHPDNGLHGRGMRVDFDFHGHTGYGIVRRQMNIDLPSNYEFAFALRGDAPTNTLEFKLVDSLGSAVWWSNNKNFNFPRQWTTVTRKKREICFAWGPRPRSGAIRHLGAIEFAITAGSGGKGSVWLDDLLLVPLEVESPYAVTEPVSSNPLVGSWESVIIDNGDHMGAKFEFNADSTFVSKVGFMGDFGYEIKTDQLLTHFGPSSNPSEYSFANGFRVQNNVLSLKGQNMFGVDVSMTRIGPPVAGRSLVEGVWAYSDPTGTMSFVSFGENGHGRLRTPVQECSGKWTAAAGQFTVDLNGETRQHVYVIRSDTLVMRESIGDFKYVRAHSP